MYGYTTIGISSNVYTINTLYDRVWSDHNWPISEIINHLGHANYDYDMKMNNSDVAALTNTQYCFIYSQGCMAGGFDYSDSIAFLALPTFRWVTISKDEFRGHIGVILIIGAL